MHKCNISSVQFIVIRMYIYANLHVILSKCFVQGAHYGRIARVISMINVCLCFISAEAFDSMLG